MKLTTRISPRIIEVAALAGLMIASLLFYSGHRTGSIPESDSRENCRIALNLLQYGVYSVEEGSKGAPPLPTTKREPLYPALLSIFMRFAGDDELTLRYLTDEGHAPRFLRSIKFLNVLLMLGLVLASWWSARLIFRYWWPALLVALLVACNTTFLSTLDVFLSEIPSALFLVISSSLLYLTVKRKSYGYALLGGLSLGALILTKVIFSLFAVMLVGGAGGLLLVAVFRKKWEWFSDLSRIAAVALIALTVYAPWYARTQRVSDSASLDDREATILAIRAEYSTMSWKQYMASFFYFTPAVGPELAARLFGEETVRPFSRALPEGFYRKARGEDGRVNRLVREQGISHRRAAIQVMARHFPTMAMLTLPFAWRGAFVQVGFNVHNTFVPLIYLTMLCSLVFVPAFIIMIIRWLRRPIDLRLSFLALSIYSYLIHALISHYIPRYSAPLIPVFIISLVGVILAWRDKTRGRRPE